MAETTKPSPNPKPESSWAPRRLTTQEIESLRQNGKELAKYLDEAFKDVKPLVNRPAK